MNIFVNSSQVEKFLFTSVKNFWVLVHPLCAAFHCLISLLWLGLSPQHGFLTLKSAKSAIESVANLAILSEKLVCSV